MIAIVTVLMLPCYAVYFNYHGFGISDLDIRFTCIRRNFLLRSLMPLMNLMKITEVWKKVHLLMDLMLVKLFKDLIFLE